MSSLPSYTALFGGVLIAGEAVALPVLYFSLSRGIETVWQVFFIIQFAVLAADTAWYLGGRTLPIEQLLDLPLLKKRKERMKRFEAFFQKHSIRILFLSRFVIGTRAVTQMLSGAYRLRYVRYIGINAVSSLIWTVFLMSFGLFLQKALAGYIETTTGLYIVFGIFVLIIFFVTLGIRRVLRKKWFDF